MSSRWWRDSSEPLKISDTHLAVTTIWGETLTVDVANGTISRDPERFKHLVRLVRGDLTTFVGVEYEKRAGAEHIQCAWRPSTSRCDTVDRNWKKKELWRVGLDHSDLRGRLDAVMPLGHLVESPTYCAVGCTDQQELRFFFVDRGDKYSYAVVLRGPDPHPAAINSLAELLRLFRFSPAGDRVE